MVIKTPKMNGGFYRAVFSLLVFARVAVPTAKAVDEKPIDVANRWQVVGVISGSEDGNGKAFGIAVLKSVSSKRTYTISVGESLPSDGAFTLQAIRGKQVSITDGTKSYALEFATSEVEEAAKEDGDKSDAEITARFLDSYYRGVAPASDSDTNSDVNTAFRNFPQGIQRYGSAGDQPFQSRFEIYRPSQRPSGEEVEVQGDTPGATWTYDPGESEYEDVTYYNGDDEAVEATQLDQ